MSGWPAVEAEVAGAGVSDSAPLRAVAYSTAAVLEMPALSA